MLRHLKNLALAALVAASGNAYSADTVFPALDTAVDSGLQNAMHRSLRKLGLQRAVAEERLAVSLVDITDPHAPRMAQVNGDKMLYAASLPKIAILMGALQKAEEGKLDLDAETRDKLTRMIRFSSNTAATEMWYEVGEKYIADLLSSKDYQLYKPVHGGLWVGKPYGKQPAWKRDPQFNISHGATAYEVSRFYYLLATNRLVSPRSCAIMKEMLSKPAINHKFVSGISKVDPEARVYRKSGTWRTYHSDSAIIERGNKRYILVALANDANGGRWMERIAVEMDRLVTQAAPLIHVAAAQ
ncbi:MAG: serine hydrolase [Pseudomonadota bacterium]